MFSTIVSCWINKSACLVNLWRTRQITGLACYWARTRIYYFKSALVPRLNCAWPASDTRLVMVRGRALKGNWPWTAFTLWHNDACRCAKINGMQQKSILLVRLAELKTAELSWDSCRCKSLQWRQNRGVKHNNPPHFKPLKKKNNCGLSCCWQRD